MKEDLLKFLQTQKLLTLSTFEEEKKTWIANVYYSADADFNLFFVSSTTTRHSVNIEKTPEVSFAVTWYDKENLEDRKAVQATGICEQIHDVKTTLHFIKTHLNFFPDWKDYITLKNIQEKLIESRPYIIKPNYIKFWNDELYGESPKEFTF